MLLRRARRRGGVAAAVLAWGLLVAAAVLWGLHLRPGGLLAVASPPFQGHYRFAPASVVPAALYAAVGIVVLPPLAARLRWRPLLAVGVAAAAGWAVLLALWDGHPSLSAPIDRPPEYLTLAGKIGAHPGGFLSGFADGVAHLAYAVHVNGHPPLPVLVFWALDRIGLGDPGWAAALVIGAGSSSVAAVAVTLRALGQERAARAAWPFLVLGPFAVTVATSVDALFLGVTSWAAAALAVGLRRRSWPAVATAGVLTGAVPYLSYGLLAFGSVLAVVTWLAVRRPGHRSWWLLAAFGAGAVVVPAVLTLGGFWWPDGVAATHVAWAAGKGSTRPYLYSLVGDFGVLAVLVGPATAAAAVHRPRGAAAALAGAALVSLVTLALSGVTRLEVERIWMPFAPWLLLLTAGLTRRPRLWLLLNACCALAFQVFVRDVW